MTIQRAVFTSVVYSTFTFQEATVMMKLILHFSLNRILKHSTKAKSNQQAHPKTPSTHLKQPWDKSPVLQQP